MPLAVEHEDLAALNALADSLELTLSEATKERLITYVVLLRRWQPVQNLVSARTLTDVWFRHVGDALQMVELIDSQVIQPNRSLGRAALKRAVRGVDLGTGAGLPGMVLALATADYSGDRRYAMTLIDSNARKTAFLRAVSRETSAAVDVRTARIEDTASFPAQFVTARALAPLPKLINLADPWLASGAVGVFHKGVESAHELAQWADRSDYSVIEHPSRVDADSTLLLIRRLAATTP